MEVQSCNLSEFEILKRFADMEKHFPRCTGKWYSYASFNFYLNFHDDPYNTVKEEAEKMMSFVGMGMYTAKIKVEKLHNAAGLIELTNDMYANITLDKDVFEDSDRILATLAHELCHKILYKNGIYFKGIMDYENEIYADLATFYVGFGNLIMLGYNTETYKSGYLTQNTYSLAYNIISTINGKYETSYLPNRIISIINDTKYKCQIMSLGKISNETISSLFMQTSSKLSELKYIYDTILILLQDNLKDIQKYFSNISNSFYNFPDKDLEWHKLSLSYCMSDIKIENSENSSNKIHRFKETLLLILDLLIENGLVKIENLSSIATKKECPVCQFHINKNLELKYYHLICPKCKTHFIIDNDYNSLIDALNVCRKNRKRNDKYLNEYPKMEKSYKTTINSLNKKINHIESRWWYKLMHKLFG